MNRTSKPCEVHGMHAPRPVENILLTVAGSEVVICPTGLRNLQIAVEYMSGGYDGPSAPNRIGKPTWDLAQAVVTHRESAGLSATSESGSATSLT